MTSVDRTIMIVPNVIISFKIVSIIMSANSLFIEHKIHVGNITGKPNAMVFLLKVNFLEKIERRIQGIKQTKIENSEYMWKKTSSKQRYYWVRKLL